MDYQPHFISLLTYHSELESGRSTPASSGFRASIKFSFEQDLFMGIQNFIDTDLVFPGDVVTAEITLLNSDYFSGKIYEGLDFEFFEGENLIGTGIITKLI